MFQWSIRDPALGRDTSLPARLVVLPEDLLLLLPPSYTAPESISLEQDPLGSRTWLFMCSFWAGILFAHDGHIQKDQVVGCGIEFFEFPG